MWRAIKIAGKLIQTTSQEFVKDDCMRSAAALAYYTVFSLAPILMFLLWLAGFFLDSQTARKQVAIQVEAVAGEEAAKPIRGLVDAEPNEGGDYFTVAISVVAILFGATGVMVQIQSTLNQAWGVEPHPYGNFLADFFLKRVLSLSMLVTLAFLLAVSLGASTAILSVGEFLAAHLGAWVGKGALWLLNAIVSLLVIAMFFGAVFKWLPDAKLRWRDVACGSLVTAVLFIVGREALSLYFANVDVGSHFGVAGSLAVLLVWVYYTSMIFLFGAEFTQVWTRSRGRRIVAEAGAVEKAEMAEKDAVGEDIGEDIEAEADNEK